MSGIIRAPRAATHDTLPRAAGRDSRLSYRARGILWRLLTNADGFSMTAHDLAHEAKEGRGAVLTALKELRAAGYVCTTRNQLPNGHWTTQTFVYDTPQTAEVQKPNSGSGSPAEVQKPNPGLPDSGSPDPGLSDPKSSKALSNRSSSSKDTRADNPQNLMRAAAPQIPTPAATAPVKRKRTHERTGAVYWYTDETLDIDRLVETYGLDAVKATVATFRASGLEPLPQPLDAALREQRRKTLADQAEQARRDRNQLSDADRADNARKAQAQLDEYARLQRDAP